MNRTFGECRNEAIQKRDAANDTANESFVEECRAEDAVFDAEFDRVREEFERVRKRPRPTHDVARPRRDNAIAEAERQLDADIRHSSCNTAPAKPLQLNGRRHARHELGRTFQRGEGAGRGS